MTFVPLAQAALHGMRVQVPYAQAHIHDATNIDPDGQLSADEEARLYQHYGLDYDTARPSGAGSEFIAPATDKVEEAAPAGTRLRRHEAAD